jgi:hypothetical protein
MIEPEYILYYWAGENSIPRWRDDCVKQLRYLYPLAKIIEYKSNEFNSYYHCDIWRLKKCSELNRCLWVDNDIWLDCKLDLTDIPAVADEYGVGHISICWSGDNIEAFDGLEMSENYNHRLLQSRVKEGKIGKLKITGTHYASNKDGSQAVRTHK